MSELTELQKISALATDLMNKKMNDTDRFVHLSHIHELAEELQPELNENQQIVLDWLKSDDHPNYSNIFDLFSDLLEYQVPTKVGEAFTEMMTDKKQQIQVLQAFSCWAIEQEEE